MLPDKDYVLQILNKHTTKDSATGCWLFQGVFVGGYGQITVRIDGKKSCYKVHRLSLYIFKDFDLIGKLHALHKLECLNRNCWNPDHLYAGTQDQNNKDKSKLITHCPKGHEYTKQSTGWQLRKRYCKICNYINTENWKKKQLKGKI